MKGLKKYIIESIERSNNEAIDNFIYEGFLDKLKGAIEKIVDDPQKYFDVVRKNFQKMKDSNHILSTLKKEPEKVAEELDKLNNDEDLKRIYSYTKGIMKKGYGDELYDALLYPVSSSSNAINIILTDIKKNFDNCDENKSFAIAQIAMALANAISNEKQKQEKKGEKSSGYDSKYSNNDQANAIGTAVAIALL
jgi:hypothetical protein